MNKFMKRFLLLTGVGSLVFSVACGGFGTGGNGGGGGGGNGSFSNASLSGQYAYQLKGYSSGPFREAGVFTADGNGHITSGKDDLAFGTTVLPDNSTGTYQVDGNGIATVFLNFAGGGSSTFVITLSSSSQFYMIETDSGAVASGTAQKQDTTAFASVPNGTFVMRMHTVNSAQSLSSTIGAFTVTGGSVTGSMDKKTGASFAPTTITGSLNFPDATTGRGSGTFQDTGTGATTSFQYYVVDASHLIFFSTDAGVLGIGQAEKQTGGPFTTASFTGPYAFGTSGDTTTPNFLENTNTAGRFTGDGSGTISAGVLDNVTNGTVANVTFTGTYTVANTGRAAVTLAEGSNNIQQVYWMISPNRAFFITNSPTSIEDGILDTQVGTFSNSSLNGIYAFGITGFDGNLTNDLTGTLTANGTGTLSMALVPNVNGTVAATVQNFSGTYTVGSNGRTVGVLNGFSNNLIMYMVSPSSAYVLQADTGVQLQGTITKQP